MSCTKNLLILAAFIIVFMLMARKSDGFKNILKSKSKENMTDIDITISDFEQKSVIDSVSDINVSQKIDSNVSSDAIFGKKYTFINSDEASDDIIRSEEESDLDSQLDEQEDINQYLVDDEEIDEENKMDGVSGGLSEFIYEKEGDVFSRESESQAKVDYSLQEKRIPQPFGFKNFEESILSEEFPVAALDETMPESNYLTLENPEITQEISQEFDQEDPFLSNDDTMSSFASPEELPEPLAYEESSSTLFKENEISSLVQSEFSLFDNQMLPTVEETGESPVEETEESSVEETEKLPVEEESLENSAFAPFEESKEISVESDNFDRHLSHDDSMKILSKHLFKGDSVPSAFDPIDEETISYQTLEDEIKSFESSTKTDSEEKVFITSEESIELPDQTVESTLESAKESAFYVEPTEEETDVIKSEISSENNKVMDVVSEVKMKHRFKDQVKAGTFIEPVYSDRTYYAPFKSSLKDYEPTGEKVKKSMKSMSDSKSLNQFYKESIPTFGGKCNDSKACGLDKKDATIGNCLTDYGVFNKDNFHKNGSSLGKVYDNDACFNNASKF